MTKEVLAALKRIEAIAHYYGSIAGQPDEITQAFKAIVDEAGDAIAEMKDKEDGRCDHTFKRCKHMINVCTKCGVEGEMD